MSAPTLPRYVLTRMKADRAVATRYQRSGWMAFDRTHQDHGQVWPSRAEAAKDVARLNSRKAPR
jgi:hypothetical protein